MGNVLGKKWRRKSKESPDKEIKNDEPVEDAIKPTLYLHKSGGQQEHISEERAEIRRAQAKIKEQKKQEKEASEKLKKELEDQPEMPTEPKPSD